MSKNDNNVAGDELAIIDAQEVATLADEHTPTTENAVAGASSDAIAAKAAAPVAPTDSESVVNDETAAPQADADSDSTNEPGPSKMLSFEELKTAFEQSASIRSLYNGDFEDCIRSYYGGFAARSSEGIPEEYYKLPYKEDPFSYLYSRGDSSRADNRGEGEAEDEDDESSGGPIDLSFLHNNRACMYRGNRGYSRQELKELMLRYVEGADPRMSYEIKVVINLLDWAGLLAFTRVGEGFAELCRVLPARHWLIALLVPRYLSKKQFEMMAVSELARAVDVWRRKFRHLPNTPQEKALQIQTLRRRGFGMDVIRRLLSDGLEHIKNDLLFAEDLPELETDPPPLKNPPRFGREHFPQDDIN